MAEDRKFRFDHENGQFVNRMSGEAIPHDEPVILFRARDIHSLSVLGFYLGQVSDPHHSQVVRERIDEFFAFQQMNPHRMKEPGITHHAELHSSRRDHNLHESRRHERSQDERLDRLETEEATLERKMGKAMADIDELNAVLGNIANDATVLMADFKGLEAELQAAQEAAANNQPIDLSSSILLARQAQAALDAVVQAAGSVGAGPAAPPVDEQPVDEQPVDEQPVDEQPVDEQPVDEQPVDEQPAAEEPAPPSDQDGEVAGAETPAAEQPIDEQPTE